MANFPICYHIWRISAQGQLKLGSQFDTGCSWFTYYCFIFYIEFQECQEVLCTNSFLILDHLLLWVHETNGILARIASCSLLKVVVEIVLKDPFSLYGSPRGQ